MCAWGLCWSLATDFRHSALLHRIFSYWKLNSPQTSKCGKCCSYAQTCFDAERRKARKIGCDESCESRPFSTAVVFFTDQLEHGKNNSALQSDWLPMKHLMLPINKGNKVNPLNKEHIVHIQSGFPRLSKDLKSFVVDEE